MLQSKRAQEVRVPVGGSLADLSVFDFGAVSVSRLFTKTYGVQASLFSRHVLLSAF